ncbi:MAG: helix-turn-helix transcriptional regulator [Waterburya sp.]
MANELGVRPQAVSNWEKGVSIPKLNPEQTLRLCSILKISLDELVKGFKAEVTIND